MAALTPPRSIFQNQGLAGLSLYGAHVVIIPVFETRFQHIQGFFKNNTFIELLSSLCAARLRLQGDYIAPSRHAFNFLLVDQTFLELTVNSYKHFSALRYDPNLLLLLQDAGHHHKIDTTERSSRFLCSYTHAQGVYREETQ